LLKTENEKTRREVKKQQFVWTWLDGGFDFFNFFHLFVFNEKVQLLSSKQFQRYKLGELYKPKNNHFKSWDSTASDVHLRQGLVWMVP